MNSADYIMEVLSANDVKTVFMLNGGGMMHLVDAVERHKHISYAHHHHEQCAGIAADSHARVTQRLGVCFATSGPGGTNLSTAIAGAYQDSTPCMFIIGQSKTTETIAGKGVSARQVGTFEVDIIPTVQSITKYSVTVDNHNHLPELLRKAITHAISGRPGPCVIEIPLDIQGANIPDNLHDISYYETINEHDNNEYQKNAFFKTLKKDLENSSKPTLLIGKGVMIAKQQENLENFAAKHNIPVVTTQFGKDCYDNYDELFMGHSGPKGTRAGNYVIQNSDIIITLGCSLHGQTIGWEEDLFAPNAIVYRVDVDEKNLQNKKSFVKHDIQLDVREFFEIIENLQIKVRCRDWLSDCQLFKNENKPEVEIYSQEKNSVNAYDIIFEINQCFTDNEIFVSDAGTAFYVTGQILKTNRKQKFITSASLGAMGFALPAATGAAIANRKRHVVCITGDGSLITNMSELSVAKQYCQNIIYIIISNEGYVSMRNTQDAFFEGRRIGEGLQTGVRIPSIQKIAELFEINFQSARSKEQLHEILLELKEKPGPHLVEVTAPKEQEIIPTVKSRKLDNGQMVSGTLHPMFPYS